MDSEARELIAALEARIAALEAIAETYAERVERAVRGLPAPVRKMLGLA